MRAGLDEVDEAFACLDRAVREHDSWITFSLAVLPVLDRLRPDPRFGDLVRRIGLPEDSGQSG